MLHFQKSELPEGKTLVASCCHLLLVSVHVMEKGGQPLLMTSDLGPISRGHIGSGSKLTVLMFKRRKSTLRLEKGGRCCCLPFTAHATAQSVISNKCLGTGGAAVATVRK